MTSEIRTNSLKSRAGLSTVTLTDSGPMFSGITTFVDNSTFSVGTGGTIHAPATNTLNIGVNNTESIRIDSNSNLKVAGIVTATHFYGNGSNLTGITGTIINNNATTKFITGTNNANELDCEANLSYNNSLVTFASSSLMVSRTASPTISVKETAGNKEGAFRANTDGVLIRTLGNYPLIFHTNQTERAQIDGSGRFLIGTNSVYNANSYSNNLIVYENGDTGASIIGNNSNSNYASLYLSDTSTPSRAYLESQLGSNGNFTIGASGTGPIRFVNNGAERARIDGNGRLQVGMTSNLTGTAKLEVMGTGDNSYPMYSYAIGVADTRAYNASTGPGMGIGFTYKHNNSGSYALGCGIRGFKENTTDGDYAGAMAFYTRANGAGAGERGRFSSAGTFGVGTANPDSNFKIDCNGRLRIGDGNAGHRIQFSRSGLGDELVIGVDGYGSSTNNEAVIQSSINTGRPLVLRTSNGDRLRISAGGRVGVYETEAKLGNFAEAFQVRGLYSNQYAIAAKINQSSGSIMRFSTVNPTNGADAVCGSITGNGTSSSFNTSSDYRLKENDVIITDGITRIKQLRPIRFNWKTDLSSTQDGFFAHEVSPVVPESVTGEKDAEINEIGEGYQKIDHSKLVPLLTAALQEAITEIETLKTKVAALEGS